ncbi:zinc finger MYM-type protein 5-like [Aphis craccivora]|uniref:Zinc finger MYM-type protein 5-like n=1 Tax=Aphis craccivora TaxID=307492 RepID=A0A6G0Y432_APHCR|nr:zinc finger MYM-type protein 5-like [Aphis craccivora]
MHNVILSPLFCLSFFVQSHKLYMFCSQVERTSNINELSFQEIPVALDENILVDRDLSHEQAKLGNNLDITGIPKTANENLYI